MKTAFPLRMMLILICGINIVNSLVLNPIAQGTGLGPALKWFFGVALLQNLDIFSTLGVVVEVLWVASNYMSIAGLVMALLRTEANSPTSTGPAAMNAWGTPVSAPQPYPYQVPTPTDYPPNSPTPPPPPVG